MPFSSKRQDLIAGIIEDVRNSHKGRKVGPVRPIEPGLAEPSMAPIPASSRLPMGAPVRAARASSVENPFASFYETRRKVSVRAAHEDTADPSSSITRAYIVPEALLALARGERERMLGAVDDEGGSSVRFVATVSSDEATESTSMSRFRSHTFGFAEERRALQRLALQVAGWLRRALRRPIPD